MSRQVSPKFWLYDTLLVLGASVLAPVVAMVTLFYLMLLGWFPLLLLLGLWIGRKQHDAAGLVGHRARWMWTTALLLELGTVLGCYVASRLEEGPWLTSPALAAVLGCALVVVLAGHWLLLRLELPIVQAAAAEPGEAMP